MKGSGEFGSPSIHDDSLITPILKLGSGLIAGVVGDVGGNHWAGIVARIWSYAALLAAICSSVCSGQKHMPFRHMDSLMSRGWVAAKFSNDWAIIAEPPNPPTPMTMRTPEITRVTCMAGIPRTNRISATPIVDMLVKHKVEARTIFVLSVEDNPQQNDGTPNICRHLKSGRVQAKEVTVNGIIMAISNPTICGNTQTKTLHKMDHVVPIITASKSVNGCG